MTMGTWGCRVWMIAVACTTTFGDVWEEVLDTVVAAAAADVPADSLKVRFETVFAWMVRMPPMPAWRKQAKSDAAAVDCTPAIVV